MRITGKYRIEVWKGYTYVTDRTSDNPYEMVAWFDDNWKGLCYNGKFDFFMWSDGEILSDFDKEAFLEQYGNKNQTSIGDIVEDDIDKLKYWVYELTKERDEYKNRIAETEKSLKEGTLSDGYHTFNDLYYQRCVLFATIVNQNKEKAWKSYRHEDGELCFGGGWFIVGVDTPNGSYTYHYENKYWDMFKCVELERSKHWDGHTDKDVERMLSL